MKRPVCAYEQIHLVGWFALDKSNPDLLRPIRSLQDKALDLVLRGGQYLQENLLSVFGSGFAERLFHPMCQP